VLDGPDGFGLAFFLFGARVFWVPPVTPKRVPKRALRRPVEAWVEGLCVFGILEFPSEFPGGLGGKNGPEWLR
jgi:hypothetical protein